MSITIQHTQENLCRAHIQAVAAIAGVNVWLNPGQDYGVDGQFDPVTIRGNRRVTTGFMLPFQAKATFTWERANGCIVYDLEAKAFNDMVMRSQEESTLLLVLLCLPRDASDWHFVDHNSTIISHCCYWHVLDGDITTNTSTKRIYIPEDQLLNPTALSELLEAERARRLGLW